MRGRRKENVSKEGKGRGNLHPTLDGDTDGDPYWNTELNTPQSKWMKSRRMKKIKKSNQDCEGCEDPLIQGD